MIILDFKKICAQKDGRDGKHKDYQKGHSLIYSVWHTSKGLQSCAHFLI